MLRDLGLEYEIIDQIFRIYVVSFKSVLGWEVKYVNRISFLGGLQLAITYASQRKHNCDYTLELVLGNFG